MAVLGAPAATAADSTPITLYAFAGQGDGAHPWGGLTPGGDGKLYGTTVAYADSTAPEGARPGTFFSIGLDGSFQSIHPFTVDTEGVGSTSSLRLGSDGSFYGTSNTGCAVPEAGCVVRISRAGVVTVLHNFEAGGPRQAESQLLQASDGNFYGTTNYGGSDDVGTIFRLTPAGDFHVLHSMDANIEGAYPSGSLIELEDGDFYGTTEDQGSGGRGSVFRVTPEGSVTVVHAFAGPTRDGGTDGSGPVGGLTAGADGALYGVTWGGGNYGGLGGGTLYRVSPAGEFAIVHVFDAASEYNYPYAALVSASDGKLYGTALNAPVNTPAAASIFSFDPASRTVETLHLFTQAADGRQPYAEMVQASDGKLYGTTYAGGASGLGTVFRLDIGAAAVIAPAVSLTVSPQSVVAGSDTPVTLSWSSTNASACMAGGGWSGAKNPSGSESLLPPSQAGDVEYTLTCSGPGGSTVASAALAVAASPDDPQGEPSTGGGALDPNVLLALAATVFLRRRPIACRASFRA
jgi:uncharacterized repeat protein (TIGR03803 family)